MTTINALTMHQPSATLIELGEKTIETRSYPPPKHHVGQPLAIHAGVDRREVVNVMRNIRAIGNMMTSSVIQSKYGPDWSEHIPYGHVVAVARLGGWFRVNPDRDRYAPFVTKMVDRNAVEWTVPEGSAMYRRLLERVDGGERVYGNLSPGRFGWLLDDVQVLAEPIPAKGHQRIWQWDYGDNETISSIKDLLDAI